MSSLPNPLGMFSSAPPDNIPPLSPANSPKRTNARTAKKAKASESGKAPVTGQSVGKRRDRPTDNDMDRAEDNPNANAPPKTAPTAAAAAAQTAPTTATVPAIPVLSFTASTTAVPPTASTAPLFMFGSQTATGCTDHKFKMDTDVRPKTEPIVKNESNFRSGPGSVWSGSDESGVKVITKAQADAERQERLKKKEQALQRAIKAAKEAGDDDDAVKELTNRLGMMKFNRHVQAAIDNAGASQIERMFDNHKDAFAKGLMYVCSRDTALWMITNGQISDCVPSTDAADGFKYIGDLESHTRIPFRCAVHTGFYENYKKHSPIPKVSRSDWIASERSNKKYTEVLPLCVYCKPLQQVAGGPLIGIHQVRLFLSIDFVYSMFTPKISKAQFMSAIKIGYASRPGVVGFDQFVFRATVREVRIDSQANVTNDIIVVDSDALSVFATIFDMDEHLCADVWNVFADGQIVNKGKENPNKPAFITTLQNRFGALNVVIRDLKAKRLKLYEAQLLALERQKQNNGSQPHAAAPGHGQTDEALAAKDTEIATLKTRLALVEKKAVESENEKLASMHLLHFALKTLGHIEHAARSTSGTSTIVPVVHNGIDQLVKPHSKGGALDLIEQKLTAICREGQCGCLQSIVGAARQRAAAAARSTTPAASTAAAASVTVEEDYGELP